MITSRKRSKKQSASLITVRSKSIGDCLRLILVNAIPIYFLDSVSFRRIILIEDGLVSIGILSNRFMKSFCTNWTTRK